MNCRHNEPPRTWFRSDRFFRSNQQWYFYTREGFPVGPYQSRIEAEVDAGMLMAIQIGLPERDYLGFGPGWLRPWYVLFFTILVLGSLAIKMTLRIE
jgi:hypothetical protein